MALNLNAPGELQTTRIQDLPAEVIDDILLLAKPRTSNAWAVSQVCHTWRARCMTHFAMWNTVSSQDTIACLKEALRRSGTHVLRVFILDDESSNDFARRVRFVVRVIEKRILRIESIECDMSGKDLSYACLGIEFPADTEAPALRSVNFTYADDNALLRILEDIHAPFIENVQIDVMSEHIVAASQLWANSTLRSLTLTEMTTSVTELTECLKGCKRLQRLSLTHGDFGEAPVEEDPPIELPDLVQLSLALQPLDMTQLLDKLDLPRLVATSFTPSRVNLAGEDWTPAMHPLDEHINALIRSILRTVAKPLRRRRCDSIHFGSALIVDGTEPSQRPAGYPDNAPIMAFMFEEGFARQCGLLSFAREVMFGVIAMQSTLRTLDIAVPTVSLRAGWTVERHYPRCPRAKFAKTESSILADLFTPSLWDDTYSSPLPSLASIKLRCVSDALQPVAIRAIANCVKRFRDKANHAIDLDITIQELRGDPNSDESNWELPPDTGNDPQWLQCGIAASDYETMPRPDLGALEVAGVTTRIRWKGPGDM
ncbi:unnamed protein product [Peniophora sp. CBMAI 1063]|nr:unnamed protein product [Peniophora sp. CBMAI 1063]